MTTIQIASDLHFEFLDSLANQNRIFGPDDVKADILVLAGDLSNSPFKLDALCQSEAKQVIILMGNHEYYGHDLTRIDIWKEHFSVFSHVHVMDKEVIEFPEYNLRIIGATLWASLAEGRHADICRQMIADFSAIKGMTTNEYMRLHTQAVDYIDHILSQPFEGKTIVATHHAPSWNSQHPKYAASPVAGLFCSNLDDLIMNRQPDIWFHGHTHEPFDYDMGKTRVVCNPSGYLHEKYTFLKDFIIEI